MSNTLFELSAEMLNIERELEDNGGELTPELEQALTFTQEALMQKADNISALIRKFEASAQMCKAEKERVAKLQKQAENAVSRLKEMVLFNLNCFGIDKLEGSTCKMSKRRSEKVEANEDVLLAGYTHQVKALQESLPSWVKVDIKIDKTELKKQIKEDGVIPDGAGISENFSLILK